MIQPPVNNPAALQPLAAMESLTAAPAMATAAFQTATLPNTLPAVFQDSYTPNPLKSCQESTTSSVNSEPKSVQLSNGAQGWIQQVEHRPNSHLSVLLPINDNALAERALLPQLLLEGSEQTKQLIQEFESKGFLIAASVERDGVLLELNGPTGQEQAMTQLAMRLLLQPRVSQKTFDTTRLNALKSLVELDNIPDSKLGEAIAERFYGPHHPYAATAQDNFTAISETTLDQILASYAAVMQRPQDIQLLMVSGQPTESQASLLEQASQQAQWKANPSTPKPIADIPEPSDSYGAVGPLLVADESLDRAKLQMVTRAPLMSDPDYTTFALVTKLLGGMTGGLFRILRTERGLVYSTHQSFTSDKQATAYGISAQVDFDKVPQALEGLDEALAEVMDSPPKPEDLEKVKRQFILDLRQARQTSNGLANMDMNRLSAGLPPESPESLEARVLAVTPEDIQRVAKRFLAQTSPDAYSVWGLEAPKAVLEGMNLNSEIIEHEPLTFEDIPPNTATPQSVANQPISTAETLTPSPRFNQVA